MGVLPGDEPRELARARLVIELCERFHCLPDKGGLLDQDAEFLRMLKIVDLAGPSGGEEGGYG